MVNGFRAGGQNKNKNAWKSLINKGFRIYKEHNIIKKEAQLFVY